MTTADYDENDIRYQQMEAAAKKIKTYSFSVPPIVYARAPHNKKIIVALTIAKSHLVKLGGGGRRQKFMSLWYNILGIIPPVPNIGFHEDAANDTGSTNLLDATALIKGLERPCGLSDNGDDIYCYVLNPEYTYEYVDHMVCAARRTSAPKDSVFAVYVRYKDGYETLDEGTITGEIISWGWLKRDQASRYMPAGYSEKELIWR